MELQNKLEQVKSLEHPAEMAATGISSHDAEADNSSPVHGLPMVKLHRLGEEEDQLDASAHEAGNQTEAEEGLQTAQHIYIGSLSDADDAEGQMTRGVTPEADHDADMGIDTMVYGDVVRCICEVECWEIINRCRSWKAFFISGQLGKVVALAKHFHFRDHHPWGWDGEQAAVVDFGEALPADCLQTTMRARLYVVRLDCLAQVAEHPT